MKTISAITLVIGLVAALLADTTRPGGAQTQPPATGEQTFTASETALIARNATLAKAVQHDPALVRRVLNETSQDGAAKDNAPKDNAMTRRMMPASPTTKPLFDGKADPDLSRIERASPEALHDLFQLLKETAAKKGSGKK